MIGEEQVIAESDRLVANTRFEAQDLVDLLRRRPGPAQRGAARRRPGPVPPRARVADRAPRSGLPERGYVVAFVGRIQPLKAPDVLISRAGRSCPLRERRTSPW